MSAYGFAIDAPDLPDGLAAIPVRTRLVLAGDDIAELAAAAVNGIARETMILAIAETAVAIAQGRFVAAETIRPSRLATILSARAGALATINQPESMQLVIDQVGAARVVRAAMSHIIGRLLGRRGVFYEELGAAIATIDGYTGTLPPYERAIVFGPAEPEATATAIGARAKCGCVIVDANDLGKVNVLGASPGVDRDLVARALRGNPHGNGDEQTPIVVLAWRGTGRNPLFTESIAA